MTKLKILICGGGIAGNALAFWLSKLDYDVTVVERYPSMRTTGLQVDLRGFGIQVLKRMGLEQAFRERSINEEGFMVVDSSDREWAYWKANKTGKGIQNFTTDYEIMRGDLCRLLYDVAVDHRVKYIFGAFVERFEEKDDLIEVQFSNGHMDQFDLMVGADGQWSRTRKAILGPGAVDPVHFLGLHIGYFTIPRPIQEGEKHIAKFYLAPGKRAIMVRRHNSHRLQVYLQAAGVHAEPLRDAHQGGVAEEKRVMAEVFRGAGWQTEEILKDLKDADDFYCERLGVVKMDSWSSGRVTLVGDAAYCPSATTGMGTTSGLVGAYVLAGEIAQHCRGPRAKDGVLMALKAYDEKFRPFMDQVQHGVVERGSRWNRVFPTTPFTIAIFNFFLAVVAFLRLDIIAAFILRESVEKWTLPEYNEMVDGTE